MALGGGIWITQNKVVPGAYINFVSKERPNGEVTDRGISTVALEFDWGVAGEVFRVGQDEFQTSSQSIFGYDYAHPKLLPLRELFKKAKTVYCYRLNSDGKEASNDLAKAKYTGTRGNDISIAVQSDPDNTGSFIVYTYLTTDGITKTVDKQTNIKAMADVENNDYVNFVKTATLAVTVSKPLTGGTNGSQVTTSDYQNYIEHIEKYYYNTMAYAGSDSAIQSLLIAFNDRIRTTSNNKFQLVIFGENKANSEGVIAVNPENYVKDSGVERGALVYWTAGDEAACAINKSCEAHEYDGELTVNTNIKQFDLELAIKRGYLTFHDEIDAASGDMTPHVRILADINTFTNFSKEKNKNFSYNQAIRVIDNLSVDFSRLFANYHRGKTNNDSIGQISLWNDGVDVLNQYQQLRAIQNFDSKNLPLPVEGKEENSVYWPMEVDIVYAMSKLYMVVVMA